MLVCFVQKKTRMLWFANHLTPYLIENRKKEKKKTKSNAKSEKFEFPHKLHHRTANNCPQVSNITGYKEHHVF